MKIIKKRNGEDWSLKIRCEVVEDDYGLAYDDDKEHCGSMLKIDKNDVMSRHWQKYTLQTSGTDYVVKCPKCGCCLYINPSLLPKWVKAKADKNQFKSE